MCGISGVLSRRPVSPALLGAMNAELRHRGPDQEGLFIDEAAGVHLAHRRLSIIDPSDRGRQPMTSACGRYVVVYNGEIYNYVELRQRLRAKGCVFRSDSDTEVLLQAYAQWGPDCLEHFTGMFAFALYDIPAGRVMLARDRIGEKPLYYVEGPDLFAFASEVKALRPLSALGLELGVDPEQVASFMGFMWAPDRSRTLIRHVRRLQPGERGTFDLSSRCFQTARYWELGRDRSAQPGSFAEAVDRYDQLLDESVRLRLRADVPVAVMLSGGIDSSLIAAMARRHVTDLRTFTLVFRRSDSEGPFASTVANHVGSRHEELLIETHDMLGRIKAAIPTFDDLSTVDGGLISTIAMCRLVREKGVKVVLLGEGSDEVNAGYSRFRFSRPPFSWTPSIVRNSLFYYSMSHYPVVRRGFAGYARTVHRLLQSSDGDPLQRMTRYEVRDQLPNHLLMKVDKATMAESVEARVPFLDPSLVEFVLGLPARFKYRGWGSGPGRPEKVVLREVAARHLPLPIVGRRKFGMLLPIGDVVNQNASAIREELLDDRESPVFGFTTREEIDGLLTGRTGLWRTTEREWFLWKVYVLHLWWRWWSQSLVPFVREGTAGQVTL